MILFNIKNSQNLDVVYLEMCKLLRKPVHPSLINAGLVQMGELYAQTYT